MDSNSQNKKKPRSVSAQFWVVKKWLPWQNTRMLSLAKSPFSSVSLRLLQMTTQGPPRLPSISQTLGRKQWRAKHGTGNARIPRQRITGVCHLEMKEKAIAEKQLHCVTEDTAAQRWKDSVHHCFIFTLTADEHSTEEKSCTHTRVCLVWTNNLLSGESI